MVDVIDHQGLPSKGSYCYGVHAESMCKYAPRLALALIQILHNVSGAARLGQARLRRGRIPDHAPLIGAFAEAPSAGVR